MDISIWDKGRYYEHPKLNISNIKISEYGYATKTLQKLLDYISCKILSNKSGDDKN